MHKVRRELAPDASELPVPGYEKLNKPRSIAAVERLESPQDLRTVMAFEEAGKNRADVVSAIQVRLAKVARAIVID